MSKVRHFVVVLTALMLLASVVLGQVSPPPNRGTGNGRNPDARPQTGKAPGKDPTRSGRGDGKDQEESSPLPDISGPIKKQDVNRLRYSPLSMFEELGRTLDLTIVRADQLFGEWMSVGSARHTEWLALSVRIVNNAKNPVSKIALRELTVDGKPVSPGTWVKNHSRYLNSVVFGVGSRMARLKGQLNADRLDVGGIRLAVPKYEGTLIGDLGNAAATMRHYRGVLTEATTVYDVDYVEHALKHPRNLIKRTQRTLTIRNVLAKAFFKSVDPKSLKTELDEITATFSDAKCVQGVDPEWLKYQHKWLAFMAEALAEYEDDYEKTTERWKHFVEGKFYSSVDAFKDLKPGDLIKPMDELEQLCKERKTFLAAQSKIQAEIESAKEWAGKLKAKYLGESRSSSTEAYDEIKKIAQSAPAQIKDQLLKMADRISPDKEKALIEKITDLMAGVNGETFDGLLADLTGAAASSSARDRLKGRFQKLVDGQNRELSKLTKALREFRYHQKVLLEDARKMMEKLKR